MRVAVGNVFVDLILALCLGFYFCWVVCFVFLHQSGENFFESVSGDGSIGIGRCKLGRRCRLNVGILIFGIGLVLLEKRHVVDELLELLVNEVSDKSGLVG